MKIHLIGIGGMGMAALARLLIEAGHEVSGSDKGIFPPMSNMIKSLNLEPSVGYSPEHIPDDISAVVVGNAITKENPEAREALRKGVKCYSMAQALYELFLKDRTPIVVAGTHGKTTTTLMLSWVLDYLKEDSGFFAGGIGLNWNLNSKLGKGPLFVVEGDEYDTAFFDKRPKFIHYAPKAVLFTSLEFDHADIYPNLEAIDTSFKQLLSLIPPEGLLVANIDDDGVKRVSSSAKCEIVTYGMNENADYRIHEISVAEDGISFKLNNDDFKIPMMGNHNIHNSVAVAVFALKSGFDASAICDALMAFKGVARRQELIGEVNDIKVYDDFAHHPTAVSETLDGFKKKFPTRKLWAVFEPRSHTMRRNVSEKNLAKALAKADRAIIAPVFKAEKILEDERMNPDNVVQMVFKNGGEADYVTKTSFIEEFLIRKIDKGDVIVFMSNGDFDGLPQKVLAALKRRRW